MKQFRFLVYAAAIVGLFYVLTSSFFLDPLIAFLLAGIVPGTDIVLSPETVLIVLLNIFGLTVVLLLIGWLLRRRQQEEQQIIEVAKLTEPLARRSAFSAMIYHQQVASAVRRATKQSSRAAIPPKKSHAKHSAKRKSTRTVEYHIGNMLRGIVDAYFDTTWNIAVWIYKSIALVVALVFISLRFAIELIVEGVIQLGRLLLGGFKKLTDGIVWIAVFCVVLIGTLIDLTIRYTAAGWVWSYPHLQRFDGWLEVRYRFIEAKLQKRLKRSEPAQVFATVVKDGVDNVRRIIRH